MIRRQLQAFCKGEDNILEMEIKKTTTTSINLVFFEVEELTIHILDDLSFSITCPSEEQKEMEKRVNNYCKQSKTKNISELLHKITDTYSELFLTTPSTNKQLDYSFTSNDEISDKEDGFDDVGEEEGEEFVLEDDDIAEEDDIYESIDTIKMKEKQFEMIRKKHQKMFEKTQSNIKIAGVVGKMSKSSKTDWKKKKADLELYIYFYIDGFVLHKPDGELKSLDDPRNKKMFESLQKGFVPRELNPKHAREIDVHVIWNDFKYEDRNDEEKRRHGVNETMNGIKSSHGGKVIDSPDTISKEWHCGVCSMKNTSPVQCSICSLPKQPFGKDVLPTDLRQWFCSNCSLKNSGGRNYCAMCGLEHKGGNKQDPTETKKSTSNEKEKPKKKEKSSFFGFKKWFTGGKKTVKQEPEPETPKKKIIEEKKKEEKEEEKKEEEKKEEEKKEENEVKEEKMEQKETIKTEKKEENKTSEEVKEEKKIEWVDIVLDSSKESTRIKINFPSGKNEILKINTDKSCKELYAWCKCRIKDLKENEKFNIIRRLPRAVVGENETKTLKELQLNACQLFIEVL